LRQRPIAGQSDELEARGQRMGCGGSKPVEEPAAPPPKVARYDSAEVAAAAYAAYSKGYTAAELSSEEAAMVVPTANELKMKFLMKKFAGPTGSVPAEAFALTMILLTSMKTYEVEEQVDMSFCMFDSSGASPTTALPVADLTKMLTAVVALNLGYLSSSADDGDIVIDPKDLAFWSAAVAYKTKTGTAQETKDEAQDLFDKYVKKSSPDAVTFIKDAERTDFKEDLQSVKADAHYAPRALFDPLCDIIFKKMKPMTLKKFRADQPAEVKKLVTAAAAGGDSVDFAKFQAFVSSSPDALAIFTAQADAMRDIKGKTMTAEERREEDEQDDMEAAL